MKRLLSFLPLFFCLLLTAIPSATAYKNQDIKVGIYVYTWYDPSNPVSWEYPKIVDKPVLGFYNSSDPLVIATQIKQIQDLGIDFVMLNWWGGLGSFSDQTLEQWFSVAKENCTRLKLAMMVEPYNETENGYNYTEIYDRAYSLYEDYKAQTMIEETYLGVRPVIFFYNGGYLTGETDFTLPLDDRFYIKTVGHRKYVDFWYDDIHDYIPPTIPHGTHISVLPRFDDYWQWEMGLRDHVNVVDRYLTEGLYDQQWERALEFADENKIQYITIATWNEYPERTMIEPHYDNTAYNTDPYYLYNMTKDYIDELRGLGFPETKPTYWYQNPITFGIIILGIAVGVVFIYEKH